MAHIALQVQVATKNLTELRDTAKIKCENFRQSLEMLKDDLVDEDLTWAVRQSKLPSTDWLIDSLVDFSTDLIDRRIDRRIDWLIDWLLSLIPRSFFEFSLSTPFYWFKFGAFSGKIWSFSRWGVTDLRKWCILKEAKKSSDCRIFTVVNHFAVAFSG